MGMLVRLYCTALYHVVADVVVAWSWHCRGVRAFAEISVVRWWVMGDG